MKNCALIITCEHAVNTIPLEYQSYFKNHQDLLKSHKGYDIGALEIAKHMADILNRPLLKLAEKKSNMNFFQARASRLLIDTNRSLNHPNCFSFITKILSQDIKDEIIKNYYAPYRNNIILAIKNIISEGQTVLHLSIHSFSPIFNNKVRHVDIGLLYDKSRPYELYLAKTWQAWLKKQDKSLIVRRNRPYLGKTDGLASFCRTIFDKEQYIGFEIESNNAKVMLKENQIKFAKFFIDMSIPK